MSHSPTELERRIQPFGMGCLLHVVGLALAVASLSLVVVIGAPAVVVPAAIIVGFGWVGHRRSLRYQCGNCRARIASRDARACPQCNAQFG